MTVRPNARLVVAGILLGSWATLACDVVAEGAADPLATLQQLFDDRDFDAVIERGEALLDSLQDEPARAGKVLDLVVYAARLGGHANEARTLELADLAVATNEKAFGNPSAEMAASLSGRALVLGVAGDLEGAREGHEQALAMRETVLGPDDPAVARVASNLGDVLSRLGRYDEATSYFQRALAINERAYGPVHTEVGKVCHNLGNNLLRTGDYTGARAAYDRSLAIKEELLGPDDPELAYTLITLGVLNSMTGDYESSRASYERALKICEESLGNEDRLTLSARNNLANLLSNTGDYAAAIPLLEQTLALREERLGPKHPEVAETHHNLGVALLRIGDPESARPHFEAALAIMEGVLGPDHPDLANPHESLANIALARGDDDEALEQSTLALELREHGLGPEHPATAKSRLQVGAIHLARGERGPALESVEAASISLDRQLRETIAYMPEREALAMVDAQAMPENVLFAGLLSADGDREEWLRACWNWALRSRGVVQEELAGRTRTVLDGETPQAQQAWAECRQARAALAAVWVEGPGSDPDAFSAALTSARKDREAAEVALARVSASFRRGRDATSMDVAELATHLAGADRLVEFARVTPGWPPEAANEARDLALLLDARGGLDYVDLGASAEIDEAVRRWRTALEQAALARSRSWAVEPAMAELDRAGHDLRGAIWDPVATRVGGAAHLYLVPEGALHLIDLAALPLDDGRFLIEEGPALRLLDSGRDLARFDAADAPTGSGTPSVLALGNVDFDAAPETVLAANALDDSGYRGPGTVCRGFSGTRWPALPESREELDVIRALFADRADLVLLTGADATVSRLESEAVGRQILHLATHGYFLQGQCPEAADGENPLLLSGLVLAGANRPDGRDDGIATAEELAAMDLRGVELAVLSACDTGRGEIAVGEGVFGLRRAFDVAGAATVVMSLWPVPDDAARAWMSEFYAGIRDGAGAADASREASLARLRALREAGVPPHPELWAGFIAVGDWR